MAELLLLLIALVWGVGACLRIYRQARFFQIEEYMNLRYLRWTVAERDRWLPRRPLMAWFLGSIFAFFMSEAPGVFILGLVGLISAVAAALPPAEGEVKKAFRATDRAKRLLGASFAAAIVTLISGGLLVNRFAASMDEARFIGVGLVGLLVLLAAPLWLVLGNLLMTPVEAAFRRRFIARAAQVLAEVNPVVVGITGSYGKTTTKTILTHLLNGRYKVYPTPKSYNTLMGICLAINNDLANDRSIDYFIAEMGAYIPGEIARLSELTHPTIGIVIDVGPQHLERFGTLENTAIAKYELIKALPPDGVGVFNWDNPHVRAMFERGYPNTRIAVSKTVDPSAVPAGGPRFIASEVSETLDGLSFTVTDAATGDSEQFETSLFGEHNVTNILLATATAVHEGMTLRELTRRARGLQPAESRLVRQKTAAGITIINDAYSANPTGAISALKVLGLHQTGRRLVITPGMVELGDQMDAENRKLGAAAAQYATDVILVGARQTEPIAAGLRDAAFPSEQLQIVETLAEAVEWYQRNLQAGDTVLFLNDLPDTYSTR